MKNKKILLQVYLLLSIISLISCNDKVKHTTPDQTNGTSTVTKNKTNNQETNNSFLKNNKEIEPFIKLTSEEMLLRVMNLNLDLDSQEEQIIIYKKRKNPNGNILISIADYNNVKNSYERLSNNITLSQNQNTFVVYIDDIIGDHDFEILCSGRDNNGNTTMDILRKNNIGNISEYINIFSMAVHGTIEINQEERSMAYFQGLKNGKSFTISVTREDFDNEKKDLIRTTYYWDFPQKKYLLLSTQTIENDVAEEKQIASITNGGEKDFFRFITGPWYCEEKIIYFDPHTKNAVFFSNEIQESYIWQNTYKLLSNILFMRSTNEIINYIENEIYIEIEDYDKISITVRDIDTQTRKKSSNEIWTGKYIRMNNEIKNKTIKNIFASSTSSFIPKLGGQYLSDSGNIIEFFGNEFYMKIEDKTFTGGYAIYMSDVPILGMKIIRNDGTVLENKIYKLDYKEETNNQVIKRSITLTPGKLSIHGFIPHDTVSLRFIQLETIGSDSFKQEE